MKCSSCKQCNFPMTIQGKEWICKDCLPENKSYGATIYKGSGFARKTGYLKESQGKVINELNAIR